MKIQIQKIVSGETLIPLAGAAGIAYALCQAIWFIAGMNSTVEANTKAIISTQAKQEQYNKDLLEIYRGISEIKGELKRMRR